MYTKKKMPETERNQASNVIDTTIITHSMPLILQEIMHVLDDLHPNAEYNCKLNILLSKMAQMVSFKRVCFEELANKKLINHYAINFMPSGMGKDKICDDLDNFVFKNFKDYFNQKAKEYKLIKQKEIEEIADSKFSGEKNQYKKEEYIERQKELIRDLVIEINNATIEGFFSDADALSKAGFGSLFVKIPEFGLYLKNNKQDDLLFFTGLFEAYDGKILSKAIKYGKREKSIENMPVNTLLHSDYTFFKADIQGLFTLLMQIGLARRAFISFQNKTTKTIEYNSTCARKRQFEAYKKAESINNNLIKLFFAIEDNAIYTITESAYDNAFYPYCIKVDETCNANKDNELLNKEINSRKLKVLKLSGMFACLNHPRDLIINGIDVTQAISTVEQLSKDFKKFIDYKPKKSDGYELLFNFLLDNLSKKFNKTELINRYREFGFKRELFRKDFQTTIEIISELALEKGFILLEDSINNNSGVSISLEKNIIGTPLPEDVKELKELI